MKVGVCLPMMEPSFDRDLLLEWARRADASPLSSLGVGERVAWGGQDGFTTLAVAAGATQRIRLLSSVLAAPLHPLGLLAKQAASLDVLSGGRFTLGVGISSRPQDFAAAPAPWEGRAERFEAGLALMKRIWAGEPPEPGVPAVGPRPVQPGGPELLVGAFAEKALRRAGRLADGILNWSFAPDPAYQERCLKITEEAWREAGRPGHPRLVAALYFALGPGAREKLESFLNRYYGYADAEQRDAAVAAITTTTPEAVRDAIRRYEDVGVDELVFSAALISPDQVDRLAELVPPAREEPRSA